MNVNDPVFGITNVLITGPNRLLNRPTAVAFASTNQLWVADTGNQMLKLITLATPASGTISTYMGGYRVPGTTDSSYGPNARFNQPSGLLWVDGQGLYISDTLNNCIRLATNNPSYGLTNYAVTTYAGIPGVGNGGLQDGSAATAQFSSPVGLVQDVEYNGILVADLMNNVIRRVQNGTPAPPVPAPLIGWVDFPPPDHLSLLKTDQPFVFNNDVIIAIQGTDGTETHFTYGAAATSIPNPDSLVGSTPPNYPGDGASPLLVPPTLVSPQPDFIIKALGFAPWRKRQRSLQARFQFKVANPVITGDNAALFTVSELTTNAQMRYTD